VRSILNRPQLTVLKPALSMLPGIFDTIHLFVPPTDETITNMLPREFHDWITIDLRTENREVGHESGRAATSLVPTAATPSLLVDAACCAVCLGE